MRSINGVIDVFDTCRVLGVSEPSVRRFINQGKLKPVARVHGLYVFNVADVLALRDARAMDPKIQTIMKRPTVGERMAQQLTEAK